ncbi:hypothetical protein HYC85_011198 [Camellia sinensis]|uniref:Aminotransferase class I/classII large domain-containing protein n=1 Tax=Camellia sinensis TaxID=4442 RepID=A0A7J7HMR3_CAMSI|nr:hypothetical protein HYC85_011198 [Camellia sinensis]
MRIDCLNSNAGLFCWMDLRPLLKEPTIEAEMVPWHVIINDVKLNVSPRSSFHCTEVGRRGGCSEEQEVANESSTEFLASDTRRRSQVAAYVVSSLASSSSQELIGLEDYYVSLVYKKFIMSKKVN